MHNKIYIWTSVILYTTLIIVTYFNDNIHALFKINCAYFYISIVRLIYVLNVEDSICRTLT